MFNEDKVTEAVAMLLQAFGYDISDKDNDISSTPQRVMKYWKELLQGNDYTNQQIAQKYGKKFKVKSNALVVKEVKNVYSHCEHHLALMYNMTVTVAYLPVQVEDGFYEVIGLSKIPRIVDLCAKRLQLQERLASDIAECISLATESKDVYVNIKADHACVSARGAGNEGLTDVTFLDGRFLQDSKLRDEVERKVR